MGCYYWRQYQLLSVTSIVLTLTTFLCICAAVIPFWFVLDLNKNVGGVVPSPKPVPTTQSTMATTTITTNKTWISTRNAISTMQSNVAGRRKRSINSQGSNVKLVQTKVDAGLFLLVYQSSRGIVDTNVITERWVSMVHLGKSVNDLYVPLFMQVAQIFYISGTAGLMGCCVVIYILTCRKYASVVGEIILAGCMMSAAVCTLIGVGFSAIHFENEVWESFPILDSVILKATPSVAFNWGFYFAMIGPLFSILCAVLAWGQACKTCHKVEEIRKQQLKENSSVFSYQLVTNPNHQRKHRKPSKPPPTVYSKPTKLQNIPDVGGEFSI